MSIDSRRLPRLRRREDRRRPLGDDMLRSGHGRGGVHGEDLVDDEPVAEHTDRGQVINDNYFCRSPRRRSAGRGGTRGACDTARFPRGGRVGHGCAGSAITREANGREDAGGSRCGGRDERAGGPQVAERGVAVDGEGAAVVAHTRGPVRRGVAVGGGAAAGGRHRRTAAGADAVQGAVPAASGPLSAGAAADPAAAGPRVATWG